MDYLYSLLLDNIWRTIVLVPLLGFTLYKFVTILPILLVFRQIKRDLKPLPDYEKDVIYLHHWPRHWTRQVPNLSPFAIKLETWMRLKKIKYKTVDTYKMSKSTKQIPYIIFNGQEVAESSQIINFLSDHYNIDKTDGLSKEQLAISRAFMKLTEEDLAWTVFMDRYVYKPELFTSVLRLVQDERLYKKMQVAISKGFEKRSNLHGIGRQSKSWVEETGKADIEAISDYLANKKFLMGNEITMVDCAVFGHLCQIAFVSFPYFHKSAVSENLQRYLERIRDTLWPDWNTIVNPEPFQ